LLKHIGIVISALAALLVIFGCGGGGGGPTASVRGRVVLVGGSTISGVSVTIGGRSVTTDATGGFLLTGVGVSETQIMVSGTGIKPLTQGLPTLTANTTTDLGDIFVLSSTSTDGYNAIVVGRVVRSDTAAPISGAIVKLNGQVFTTGVSGQISFSGLPVGLGGTGVQVGLITVPFPPGTPPPFEDKKLFIDPPLGASPPNNDLGDIPLSPPVGGIPPGVYNISGTISLQGLTDLSGTTVTLIDKSGNQANQVLTTSADGKYGYWVIAGDYTVKAEHAGFQTKTQDVSLVKIDQPQTVNLTLTP